MKLTRPINFSDRHAFFASGLICASFFTLYLCTAATTVQGLDCGELVTVAARGGVVHPPGYPLFVFLGRFFCFIVPFGTPVFKTTIASSLMAAGTLAFLGFSAFLLTKQLFTGIFVSFLLGLSPLFWHYATVPEVFAGNAFSASAAIALSVWIITRNSYTFLNFFLLGLSLAAGIANHHTIILVFPLYLYALWKLLFHNGTFEKKAIVFSGFAAGVIPGFLSYILLLIPGGPWRWGTVSTVPELVHHFLRADYGSFRLLSPSHSFYFRENTLTFFQCIPRQFGYFLILLCAIGLIYSFIRSRYLRSIISILGACFIVCGPLFVLLFNASPIDFGKHIIERFYVLPLTVLSFLLALGAGELTGALRSARMRTITRTGLVIFMILGLPFSMLQSRSTLLEDYVENCLHSVKPNAVIIGSSDSELGGFLYVQHVLGKRPDVVFIAPPLLQTAWYRSFLKDRGFTTTAATEDDAQNADLRTRIIGIVRDNRSRPMYLTPSYWKDSLLMQAVGMVIPSGSVLLEIVQNNAADLDSVEKELYGSSARCVMRTIPGSEEEAAQNVDYDAYLNYARTYLYLAGLYGKAGNHEKQNKCDRAARLLARPWQICGKSN